MRNTHEHHAGNNANDTALKILINGFSKVDNTLLSDFGKYINYKGDPSLHNFRDTIIEKPLSRSSRHDAEVLKFILQGEHLPLLHGVDSIIHDPNSASTMFHQMHESVYTSHFVQAQVLIAYRNTANRTNKLIILVITIELR